MPLCNLISEWRRRPITARRDFMHSPSPPSAARLFHRKHSIAASAIDRAQQGCPMFLACASGLLALRQHCRLPAARSAGPRGVRIGYNMAAAPSSDAAAAAATAPVCLHVASPTEWSAACAALKEASCSGSAHHAYIPEASNRAGSVALDLFHFRTASLPPNGAG